MAAPVWTAPAPAAAVPVGAGPIQRAPLEAEAPRVTHQTPPQPPESVDASPKPSDRDLANLSKWLYPLIKFRLKADLREDRERAGLLTDNYRRW
jgi:hypothetical protein